MIAMPTDRKLVSIYLSPETKEKFDKWAEEEDRSLSYLGSKIIEQAIAEREKQKGENKND